MLLLKTDKPEQEEQERFMTPEKKNRRTMTREVD
jgi:hypothetical protein